MQYTKRPAFFAYKFIRLMAQTCAAADMGANATLLCMTVAMQEDVIRYTRPVTFYNAPLMAILGMARWETLDKARKSAREAGWLNYEHKGNRKAGKYWVAIPHQHQELLDLKGDHGCDAGPDLASPEAQRNAIDNSYNDGYNNGYKSGLLSLKISDSPSDSPSDNHSEPSTLSLNLEPRPLDPSKCFTGNNKNNSLSEGIILKNDTHLTVAQLQLSVSIPKHELEAAKILCDSYEKGYIYQALKKIRTRKKNNDQPLSVWISDLTNYIRENPDKYWLEKAATNG